VNDATLEETLQIIRGQAQMISRDDRCHIMLRAKAELIDKLAEKLLREMPKKSHDAHIGATEA
jgi:hypothetical protein